MINTDRRLQTHAHIYTHTQKKEERKKEEERKEINLPGNSGTGL